MGKQHTQLGIMVPIENQPLPAWIKLSVIYLFLPLGVFAAAWLKTWIAMPLLTCIAGSVGAMLVGSGAGRTARPNSRDFRFGFGIAAIAVGFAILTGLGSWIPQSADYLKHTLLLGDLIERPWPVRYPGENGGQFLCYGLGYYMVPAAIAKLLGTSHVEMLSFCWATLGLFLFLCGLGRRFARNPKLGIIVVLLCSGLGGFWTLLKSGLFQSLFLSNSTGTCMAERLMDLGLYTSNLDSFTRIFYQPQHGIVGWLGGVLIYELVFVHKRWTEAASILAATFFWSPLTSVALAVIGAAAIVANPGGILFRPSIHMLAAVATAAILVAYYFPHVPIAEKGFIWQMSDGGSWVLWYLLFLLLFVGIPVSAVWCMEKKHHYLGPMKPVVIGMTLVLICSPLFKALQQNLWVNFGSGKSPRV